MVLVYIVFVWLILMIARNIYKGKKEKEQMTISKEAMCKFNGKFRW